MFVSLNMEREQTFLIMNVISHYIFKASEMISSSNEASDLVAVLRNTALTTDVDRLEEVAESFAEHLDHAQEVSTISILTLTLERVCFFHDYSLFLCEELENRTILGL